MASHLQALARAQIPLDSRATIKTWVLLDPAADLEIPSCQKIKEKARASRIQWLLDKALTLLERHSLLPLEALALKMLSVKDLRTSKRARVWTSRINSGNLVSFRQFKMCSLATKTLNPLLPFPRNQLSATNQLLEGRMLIRSEDSRLTSQAFSGLSIQKVPDLKEDLDQTRLILKVKLLLITKRIFSNRIPRLLTNEVKRLHASRLHQLLWNKQFLRLLLEPVNSQTRLSNRMSSVSPDLRVLRIKISDKDHLTIMLIKVSLKTRRQAPKPFLAKLSISNSLKAKTKR